MSLALCILVTFRTTEVDGSGPLRDLLADLHRIDGVRRTRLEGLGDDEVIELAEAAAGHELRPAHVALAHRLREFLARSACLSFPAPIREALAARNVKTGPHAITPSAATQASLDDFREWFRTWLPQVQNEAKSGR